MCLSEIFVWLFICFAHLSCQACRAREKGGESFQRALLNIQAFNVSLRVFEHCFAFAAVSQMPGKGGWCVGVGSVGALIEDVVSEGRRVVGLVEMYVDCSVRCILAG